MATHRTVLLIDDDIKTRRHLKAGLAATRFRLVAARNAAAGFTLVASDQPAVVVLNTDLPDMDGFSLLAEIRRISSLPVIMLSNRSDEASKIRALDSGADDYLIKPVGIGEFLARLRAAIRHRLQSTGTEPVSRVGNLDVDFVNHRVRHGDLEIHLTRTEMSLLRLFIENPQKVLTHEFILRSLRGLYDTHDAQYLRVFVRSLRNKIAPAGNNIIETVTGVGYRLGLPVIASRSAVKPLSGAPSTDIAP